MKVLWGYVVLRTRNHWHVRMLGRRLTECGEGRFPVREFPSPARALEEFARVRREGR